MSNRRRYGLIIEGIGSPVPLRESIINVYVKGFIANVECKLIYQNEDIQPLQTSFVFPLDDMSAVYKFEAYLNGRHIVAECQEKEQAKRTYQDAISCGHTAMLLEEDDTSGDIFECKLGNLPGGGTAELTMGYVVELASEPPDKLRFTLPAVLNPRYTPNIGSLIPGRILPFSEDISIKSPYKMSFAASINGRHRIKSVTSSNENIDVQYNTYRTSASFQLSDLFKFDHDLSFDIVYHDVNKPEVIIEAGDTQKDGFLKDDLLMLNFLPHLKSDVNIYSNTREFIFILDRSGSMRGDRMKKSKETILLLLKSLPMNCLFNVVSFGSYYSALFTKSVEYSERTLKEALLLQRNMDADMGGTEILKPLAYIYNDKAKSDYPRQIFLLTDGEVDNTNEVISLVRKNASNTRVFSFGIGDGVSTALIKGVASASYGKATFVRDKDNMQAKVISVLKWSMEESFCDGKIEWHLPPNISVTNTPTQLPNIFRGEKLVIFGLLSGQSETNTASGSLKLTGKLDGNTVRHSIELNTIPTFDKELPLHRVAAKRQIKELELTDED